MKIYTRTGDSGETSLFGGARVPKGHPRIEACGAVDELNAFVGHALGSVAIQETRSRLEVVQHDLFALGSHLATPEQTVARKTPELPVLPESRPSEMEAWIDEIEALLDPLTVFVLPGGSPGASELHLCRTVCRRAERAVAQVTPRDSGAAFAIKYLNRLSDFLFAAARSENRADGRGDTPWRQEPR